MSCHVGRVNISILSNMDILNISTYVKRYWKYHLNDHISKFERRTWKAILVLIKLWWVSSGFLKWKKYIDGLLLVFLECVYFRLGYFTNTKQTIISTFPLRHTHLVVSIYLKIKHVFIYFDFDFVFIGGSRGFIETTYSATLKVPTHLHVSCVHSPIHPNPWLLGVHSQLQMEAFT